MITSTVGLRCLCVAACSAAAIGCGDSDFGQVTGTVIYDNKPLAGASITFSPVGEGRPSTGLTGDDGRFELATPSGEKRTGAKIGAHRVSVTAIEIAANQLQSNDSRLGSISTIGGPPPRSKSLIPERYNSGATSGLTYEVKSGRNEANFDLTP